jgi:predicted ATPase
VPRGLPSGTVTFLFTDIEGSTRLVHEHGERYGDLLAEHHRLLRETWARYGGVEVDTAGDAFFVAFSDAGQAVEAARSAQVALAATPIRVRMGLHTGEASVGDTGYFGIEVHRAARIAAVAHGGQVVLSESTRRRLAGAVRELGLHRLKDLTAPERLYQLGDDEFPPLKTLYATNLPVQPNPFIGREREVSEIAALVDAGERFLTLTGAGGSGKTRLALHAAAELVQSFRDGVWFVPLATITDPALVPSEIAQVLGLKGELVDELRGKRLLLVLDNLEQVLDAATGMAGLLAAAPDVHIVATSRQALSIAAEREYGVLPLDLEAGTMLFTDRAGRAGVDLQPDADVVAIVSSLDGLPLAIELAAARAKHLTPAQILERVRSSIDLLQADSRDAPARHRTLRATISWSHDLLSPAEQRLFARLAVFPGSFDLDAAEAAVDARLDDLSGLVDKSLLRATATGRYFMLETIRSFAVERLAEEADADAWARRHALYFAHVMPALEPGLRGHAQRETIARFNAEQPNVRAALNVLHHLDDPRPEAALAAACSYYWYLSALVAEGYGRVRAAHERMGGYDEPERGQIANACVLLAFMSGDVERVASFTDEALDVSRRHGDTRGVLRALTGIAAVAEYAEAKSLNEEMVRLARATGESWYLALGLVNLGVSERELGNFDRARLVLLEALETANEVGDVHIQATTLCNVAHVERRLGQMDAAREHFQAALALSAHESLPEVVIWCLDGLASTEVPDGDASRGALLLGAAEALMASTSYDHPETRAELAQTRAALDEALGPERAAALRAEGAASDVSQIVALALGHKHTSFSP